tara:strand:- start:254 stop:481 length:228 start_codon:yes stop_codon:yes gene_type:complete
MELIKPGDPQYFTETSSDPYDRHHYQLMFDDDQRYIVFDDYEQMRVYWFQCVRKWRNCRVNVIEPIQEKKVKGFA